MKRQTNSKTYLIPPLILILAFVNPYVEEVMFNNEEVFMASHYALAIAGGLVGYYYFSGRNYFAYLGSLLIVIWHLPELFTLGGGILTFRVLDEISLFVGGFLIGLAVRNMRLIEKILLFVLWMLGDTTLAVVLVIQYPFYTSPPLSYSPYPSTQEPLTGYVMIIAMTAILGFLLFKAFKNLHIFG
ncbi:DUF1404 domain-containing protein [Sulfurisphaera ohwakuensis]|uniref:DUF1404 domain-containing protein n=1 Tax=Sulfurisphaera ohwakuensis TaxID=69656 RepID=UPI0036F1E7EC